jgi:hypothetical protein
VTIDERLEALTQSLELLAHMHADGEKRAISGETLHNREMERHNREMEEIRREGRAMRADMRRAFAMGVREARNARRRRQELEGKMDEKITQLAAAQLITEEKLQRFIDSMGHAGNGNPREQ